MLTVAMDTALASVGGLCVGTREVVDHQRLSGAGYCFSGASCMRHGGHQIVRLPMPLLSSPHLVPSLWCRVM